jgi:hypothetical protein
MTKMLHWWAYWIAFGVVFVVLFPVFWACPALGAQYVQETGPDADAEEAYESDDTDDGYGTDE